MIRRASSAAASLNNFQFFSQGAGKLFLYPAHCRRDNHQQFFQKSEDFRNKSTQDH